MSIKRQFPVLLSVDISESDTAIDIQTDISGFRAENVSIMTWQDSLIIEMQSACESGQSYYLGELEPEFFRRVIPLGFALQERDVTTRFLNSELQIRVSKPQAPVISNVKARSASA